MTDPDNSEASLVLIVDDEPLGRAALKGILAREGYRLAFAEDGRSALSLASELTPDLILLDVMMPGLDGFEVTRRIRANPDLVDMPIVLVTALDDPRSRLDGIEAGADDFIAKPYDRAELRARVRTITRLNRFARIHREREKYRLLFERSPFGLLLVEEDLHILEINSVALDLLRQATGLDAPTTLEGILPVAELLEEARQDQSRTPRAEFQIRTSSRAPLWLDVVVNFFPPGGNQVYQIALRDLTAKRTLEAEYRHAQKIESLGQLAGGIAHDFNNILTVINGCSELALEGLEEWDARRELLQSIRDAGRRAATLTRQLLAFSRKQILSPVRLDLNGLVRDVERMLRRLLGEDLTVHTELAETPNWIKADPGQIEQVLINLAVNARDAMQPGGVLTLRTEPDDGSGQVRLTIADTGCGMGKDVLAHVFEPFFTTKETGKGTGLGLATVHGIIKQSSGSISVESEEGVGSSFRLSFPRLRQEGAQKAAPDRKSGPAGCETILVVDDEKAVRGISTMVLEKAGYRVLEAGDGEEALEVSARETEPIHLLLTDMVMPRLGGRKLAEQMRLERPNLRVLFMSGYTDDAILRQGAPEAGATFLQKPYTRGVLLQKVREVLDQPAGVTT